MKKLASIFLTLVMILGLSTTAFADNTTLTIDDPAAERSYNAYQLLTLTTGLKTGDDHPANCTNNNHTDDCYNYAYSVNPKYREILKAETWANGSNALWPNGIKPIESEVTDDQILKYLSNQTGDNDVDHGTLRVVADNIYRAIKTQNISADINEMTGNANVIEQGYWLIADVTNLSGQYEANSLVMLDTRGQSEITITPKTAIPTVEKKVKDIDDTEDDNIIDNPWHDSADHDIDKNHDRPIPFKLTGVVATNVLHYNSYELTFHDTLSSGLTLNADSIKVYLYPDKHTADLDLDMNGFTTDVTDKFAIKTTELEDTNCTFEVSCENICTIPGVGKDVAFVVYYTATLNENAVIGGAGNSNEVYLEFSNNPYDTSTGKTETDKVTVFTYQLTVNKTDSFGEPLTGAGFTLYKMDKKGGDYVAIGEELKGDAMTTFTWKGLDDGDYKLVETTVPAGYNKMDDMLFPIEAEHVTDDAAPVLTSLTGGNMGTGDVATGTIEKDIVNNTGTVLPSTGAEGTMMLIMGGALFVTVAAVFMITRKKMSIYED